MMFKLRKTMPLDFWVLKETTPFAALAEMVT